MSFRILAVIIAFGMIWLAPQKAEAFKLNPCLRVLTVLESGLGQEAIRGINPCGVVPDELQHAVHEHMTIASIAAYRKKNLFRKGVRRSPEGTGLNYMSVGAWQVDGGRQHETHAIIFGTWWNDDPNMYLLGGGGDFRKGVRKFREVFSSSVKPRLSTDLSCSVAADQHLGRASHFGALQHIHFMTTLGKESGEPSRLQATIDDALIWLEFAYKVATGERDAASPFTADDEKLLKLPSLALNLCLRNPGNAKVRSLFTRQGPQTAENLSYRNRITPDVALGSMLHLIQDSFSPAHACRVRMQRDGASVAALRRVFNYNEQDHDSHSEQDGYPDWLVEHVRTGGHRYANDPVVTGAWLIGAVDSRRPWSEVRAHLLDTVFIQAPEAGSNANEACIG